MKKIAIFSGDGLDKESGVNTFREGIKQFIEEISK